jgi:hypothetical protein
MRRKLNGAGVIQRVLVRRRKERRMSPMLIGVLSVIGTFAAVLFVRELPNLRRYLRIERM